jgi:aryl-alcohol dehydrogenase-like predicted oxidoreductase
MQFRTLGRTEIKISRYGIGCMMMGWRCDITEAREIFAVAKSFGINFLDTSVSYGRGKSHEIIKQAIPVSQRLNWVYATKVGGISDDADGPDNRGLTPHNIIRQCELSISQLGTDYIDLLQLHVPSEQVPIEDQIDSLISLKNRGLIRSFGICNYNINQINDIFSSCDLSSLTGLVSHQFSYNYLEIEGRNEIFRKNVELGLSSLIWGPLSSGLLTNRYAYCRYPVKNTRLAMGRELMSKSKQLALPQINWKLNRIRELAIANGRSIQKQALCWLAEHENIDSILLGPSSSSQLVDLVS